MEVDEIKKALQNELWNVFEIWKKSSQFRLSNDVLCPEELRMVSKDVTNDSTIQEIINLWQLQLWHFSLKKFVAQPTD